MPLTQIVDQPQHDSIVNAEASINRTSIVILVTSSASPLCRSLTPQISELSDSMAKQYPDVNWYQMELTLETTPMIKFGPQNTPIVIFMRGKYCETLLGVRMREEVERKVTKMMEMP